MEKGIREELNKIGSEGSDKGALSRNINKMFQDEIAIDYTVKVHNEEANSTRKHEETKMRYKRKKYK